MLIKSAQFITSAVKPSQYPEPSFPEVAFAGRSNVGKSSLLNVLVNRKNLVKTSKTPGRTQLINFFLVNQSFFLVDLPGYGYAKVPESIQRTWGPMIETYLSERKVLTSVALIMDIRRYPKEREINFIDWLNEQRLACIPILTKTDKLSKTRQMRQRFSIARLLSMDADRLILFSAKNRSGVAAVWKAIEHHLHGKELGS
ncbi:MAG: YihA family ribosome biogenesis GTP-binding protein [Deltaproteobacteria bacterium]|jgi:GTP-binding protein|nr:YihA family ribosome biogenesis GTP-binding protein [Deltaproteobacteria bacterium]